MPWKGERDPYRIWISEIILQQTRVEQGWKYYENFIAAYPDISSLAAAPQKEVFKLWEGLGYYSRCRNLITTAILIEKEYNGRFPTDYNDILSLKGVGPYTAAAIASFAYNLPHAVVDGNVFRILSRVFGIYTPMDSAAGKKEYTRLANELLDKKNPGTYNQAIMDFGATVCKPQAPLCNGCIFQKNCAAYYNNDVGALPLKEKKIRQQIRYFYFFLLEHNNMIAIHERTNKDIWRHLHEFALIEKEQATNIETIIDEAIKKGWLNSATEVKNMSSTYTQKLTHQRVYGIFITAALQRKPSGVGDYDWVKINTLRSLAFPKLLNSFLVKEYLCD